MKKEILLGFWGALLLTTVAKAGCCTYGTPTPDADFTVLAYKTADSKSACKTLMDQDSRPLLGAFFPNLEETACNANGTRAPHMRVIHLKNQHFKWSDQPA